MTSIKQRLISWPVILTITVLIVAVLLGSFLWARVQLNLFSKDLAAFWQPGLLAPNTYACSVANSAEQVQTLQDRWEKISAVDPHPFLHEGYLACFSGDLEGARKAWEEGFSRHGAKDQVLMLYAATARFASDQSTINAPADTVGEYAVKQGDESKRREDLVAAKAWYEMAFAYTPTVEVAQKLISIYNKLVETNKIAGVLKQVQERNDPATAAYWWATGQIVESEQNWLAAFDAYMAAAERESNNSQAFNFYNKAANAATNAGAWEQAIVAYQDAITLRPEKADTYLSIGRQYLIHGQFDEAKHWFDLAWQKNPDDHRPLLLMAIAEREKGNFEDALNLFDKALSVRPNDPETLYEKALTLDKDNRRGEAIKILDRAIRLKTDPPELWRNILAKWRKYPSQEDEPDQWWQKGKAAEKEKDWAKAAEIYHQGAAVVQPSDAYKLLLREAMMYRYLKDWDNAVALYEDLVQSFPDKVDAYIGRADVAWIQKEYDVAREWYEKARNVSPDNYRPYLYLGIIAHTQKQYEEALAFFEQALARKPDDPGILYYKATVLDNLKRRREAIADLQRAIALHNSPPEQWQKLLKKWQRYPDPALSPEAFMARGREVEKEKDWAKAVEIYHQGATTVQPPDDYNLFMREALMHRYLKEWDKASAIYEDLVARYPDKIDAYLGLGDVARSQKQYDEAALWYEKARQIAPDDYRPLYYLGIVAREQKRYDDSLQLLNQSLNIKPNSSYVVYQKALTLKAMGRKDEALATLQQAIDMHPKHPASWKKLLAKWQEETE